MAVALERTSEVVVYEVDEQRQDRLTEIARLKDVDQPTCIQWLP
jgi:6-phosphogluconolactonase (cycloisomerase 2 family)